MIVVKFFGLVSVNNNIRQLIVNDGKVSEVLDEVIQLCPNISIKQLNQAIMFVNNKQVSGKKRFSMVLKDGDELVLLNAASGG